MLDIIVYVAEDGRNSSRKVNTVNAVVCDMKNFFPHYTVNTEHTKELFYTYQLIMVNPL